MWYIVSSTYLQYNTIQHCSKSKHSVDTQLLDKFKQYFVGIFNKLLNYQFSSYPQRANRRNAQTLPSLRGFLENIVFWEKMNKLWFRSKIKWPFFRKQGVSGSSTRLEDGLSICYRGHIEAKFYYEGSGRNVCRGLYVTAGERRTDKRWFLIVFEDFIGCPL